MGPILIVALLNYFGTDGCACHTAQEALCCGFRTAADSQRCEAEW